MKTGYKDSVKYVDVYRERPIRLTVRVLVPVREHPKVRIKCAITPGKHIIHRPLSLSKEFTLTFKVKFVDVYHKRPIRLLLREYPKVRTK